MWCKIAEQASQFYLVNTRQGTKAPQAVWKARWWRNFLQIFETLERPKRKSSPKPATRDLPMSCEFPLSSSMFVCLPPQYDNDDCNGHLLKDGDTQNVSVVQCWVVDCCLGTWCWWTALIVDIVFVLQTTSLPVSYSKKQQFMLPWRCFADNSVLFRLS